LACVENDKPSSRGRRNIGGGDPRLCEVDRPDTAVMGFAVVATANHYVADVLVGSGVALTALLLVSRLRWLC
jgi:hypothetical protein